MGGSMAVMLDAFCNSWIGCVLTVHPNFTVVTRSASQKWDTMGRNRRERVEGRWDMSDVVAHRMFTARQLRGKTQAWVAERLTRYTRSTWSVSAVSAAEGGTAGGRPRLFNANEVVALARTFDLTIPYFFVPPKEPELPPDFPGAPGADWDYLLFRLFGDDALQKLVSRELGPTSLPTHLSMPAGEEFSDGSVHDVATGGPREISSTSLLAAALYGVLTSRLRGSSAVRGATGHTSEILEALSWAVAAIDGYPLTKFLDVKLAADIEEARNAHGIEEDS